MEPAEADQGRWIGPEFPQRRVLRHHGLPDGAHPLSEFLVRWIVRDMRQQGDVGLGHVLGLDETGQEGLLGQHRFQVAGERLEFTGVIGNPVALTAEVADHAEHGRRSHR